MYGGGAQSHLESDLRFLSTSGALGAWDLGEGGPTSLGFDFLPGQHCLSARVGGQHIFEGALWSPQRWPFSPSRLCWSLGLRGLCLPSPQNCMNLPPDKVQLLSQYDNEKKWELICDQVGAWKAQLPLLLLLGNPVLRMQELAGKGPACCPGADIYLGGWRPMQDSIPLKGLMSNC